MDVGIITKPKVDIAAEILDAIAAQPHEMGQIIVHCIHNNTSTFPSLIRIWPTTYLHDNQSSHTSELIIAENISYYPIWTRVETGQSYFSLIFAGLPKSCSSFDLIEDCKGGPYPFQVIGIKRNSTDVYYVQV